MNSNSNKWSAFDFILEMQKYTKAEYQGFLEFSFTINGEEFGKFEKFDLCYNQKLFQNDFLFEGIRENGDTVKFIGDSSYEIRWWEDPCNIVPIIHVCFVPMDLKKLCAVEIVPAKQTEWKYLGKGRFDTGQLVKLYIAGASS